MVAVNVSVDVGVRVEVAVAVEVGSPLGCTQMRSSSKSASLPLIISSCSPAVRLNTTGLGAVLCQVASTPWNWPPVFGVSQMLLVVGSASMLMNAELKKAGPLMTVDTA